MAANQAPQGKSEDELFAELLYGGAPKEPKEVIDLSVDKLPSKDIGEAKEGKINVEDVLIVDKPKTSDTGNDVSNGKVEKKKRKPSKKREITPEVSLELLLKAKRFTNCLDKWRNLVSVLNEKMKFLSQREEKRLKNQSIDSTTSKMIKTIIPALWKKLQQLEQSTDVAVKTLFQTFSHDLLAKKGRGRVEGTLCDQVLQCVQALSSSSSSSSSSSTSSFSSSSSSSSSSLSSSSLSSSSLSSSSLSSAFSLSSSSLSSSSLSSSSLSSSSLSSSSASSLSTSSSSSSLSSSSTSSFSFSSSSPLSSSSSSSSSSASSSSSSSSSSSTAAVSLLRPRGFPPPYSPSSIIPLSPGVEMHVSDFDYEERCGCPDCSSMRKKRREDEEHEDEYEDEYGYSAECICRDCNEVRRKRQVEAGEKDDDEEDEEDENIPSRKRAREDDDEDDEGESGDLIHYRSYQGHRCPGKTCPCWDCMATREDMRRADSLKEQEKKEASPRKRARVEGGGKEGGERRWNPDTAPPEAGSWNCSSCTFLNHPELSSCELCLEPRYKQPPHILPALPSTTTTTVVTTTTVTTAPVTTAPIASSSSSSSSVSAAEKKKTLSTEKKKKESALCSVCWERQCGVSIPCGHIYCLVCAKATSNCSVCRESYNPDGNGVIRPLFMNVISDED